MLRTGKTGPERLTGLKASWGGTFAILLVSLAFAVGISPVRATEFSDSVERDFRLRSLSKLQITNLRGGVTIQGWALDRIRVKARRKVQAATPEEAKKLFSALDFRYRDLGSEIELSAEYGRGLELQQRLNERQNPTTAMEMVVYAPANLDLTVWGVEGKIQVKNWKSSLDVRTTRGDVLLEEIKSTKGVAVLCPSCTITAKAIRSSAFRCIGGSGKITFSDFEGEQVFVETTTGAQDVARIRGEHQLYVSKAGSLHGRDLRGRIEFQTQKGAVDFVDSFGFVSGRTETGNISIEMRQWKFLDKALIESNKGNVSVTVPKEFSGEIDLWSVVGKTHTGFPIRPESADGSESRVIFGPEPANQIRGRVGDGGEQLKLFSYDGEVKLLRGT